MTAEGFMMSVMSLILCASMVLLVLVYSVGQFTTKFVRTEIEIDAPPSAVWNVLNDTEKYPAWNPFIRVIEGRFVVGSQISITIHLTEDRPQTFKPKVLVVRTGKEIRWIGRLFVPGLFDGEHSFVLHETAEGRTLLRHEERFTGVLVLPVLVSVGSKIADGFEKMDVALKARVEAGG